MDQAMIKQENDENDPDLLDVQKHHYLPGSY